MGVEVITIVRKGKHEPCEARLHDEINADQLIEIHNVWKPARAHEQSRQLAAADVGR